MINEFQPPVEHILHKLKSGIDKSDDIAIKAFEHSLDILSKAGACSNCAHAGWFIKKDEPPFMQTKTVKYQGEEVKVTQYSYFTIRLGVCQRWTTAVADFNDPVSLPDFCSVHSSFDSPEVSGTAITDFGSEESSSQGVSISNAQRAAERFLRSQRDNKQAENQISSQSPK